MALVLLMLAGPAAARNGPQPPAPVQPRPFKAAESEWIRVVALDGDAAHRVRQIGEAAVATARTWMRLPRRPDRPIVVQLEENPRALEGSYGMGNGRVVIAWSRQTPFEDTVEAVSRTLLQLALRQGAGPDAPPDPPDWLELAFALEVQARLQPTRLRAFARQARTVPLMTPAAVFALDSPGLAPDGQALNSFWLLRALAAESRDRAAFRTLLGELLRGADPDEAIEARLPFLFDAEGRLELWWAVVFFDLTGTRLPPTLDPEGSRRLLERLVEVRAVVEGAERSFDLERLWAFRKAEPVRLAARQRLREIKVAFPRVNPVYHNALHSLGRLYEAILEEEDWDDYAALLASFRADRLQANRLQADIAELMRR